MNDLKASSPSGRRKLDLKTGRVDLSHGSGGRAMGQLIDGIFKDAFDNELLAHGNDQAAFDVEGGRMVSGVGGQYDFVAMAHALTDARSIIALNSTRLGRAGRPLRGRPGQPGSVRRHLRIPRPLHLDPANLRAGKQGGPRRGRRRAHG